MAGNANSGTRIASDEAVLEAVRGAWCVWGRPPSCREIAEVLGLAHASAVLPYLDRLEAAGKIERDEFRGPGAARTVWPTGLREAVRRLARVTST